MSEVDTTGESQIEASDLAQDETIEESSPSNPTDETSAAPKAKGVQKRLDELTRLRYDAERDRDYWREMAVRNQTKAPEPEPQPQAEAQEPKLEDFTDYADFTRAQARFEARREVQEILRKEREQVQTQRETEIAMTKREAFDMKAQEFASQAPDWRQVVTSIPLSDAAFQAAQESDMGPALLYHLGKNPQLAQQIYSLSPYQQALQLGRLEAQLSAPKPKTLSGAPAPIGNALQGGGGSSLDPEKLSAEEWRNERNRQLYGKK